MAQRRYSMVYAAATSLIIAAEVHALRRHPGEQATVSSHLWWLLGPPYRSRWFAGMVTFTAFGVHIFFRWNPVNFDRPYIVGDGPRGNQAG